MKGVREHIKGQAARDIDRCLQVLHQTVEYTSQQKKAQLCGWASNAVG
jgi:hypothetical protein